MRKPWIRDALAGAFLALLVGYLVRESILLPPDLQQDNLSYLAMAEDPRAMVEVPGIHGQRPLPSLLVWGLSHLGLSLVEGFRAVSAGGFVLFVGLLYTLLRRCGGGPAVALGVTTLSMISAWPVPYALSNVYQACDALTYPVGLLLVVAVHRRRPKVASVLALSGAFIRQQLFLLGVLGLAAGYLADRKERPERGRIWIGGAVLTSLSFLALTLATGGADASGLASLWEHTGRRALAVDELVRGLVASRMPVLASPFLLVLAWEWREVRALARRFWWVAVYSLITVLQPLLAFDITGPSNAQRIAMLGVWPVFVASGLILADRLRPAWAKAALLTLPVLYGTDHLVSVSGTLTFASPVGHRSVVNGVLLLLVLAASRWCSRRSTRPSTSLCPRGVPRSPRADPEAASG